jgi:hypothetical protein
MSVNAGKTLTSWDGPLGDALSFPGFAPLV